MNIYHIIGGSLMAYTVSTAFALPLFRVEASYDESFWKSWGKTLLITLPLTIAVALLQV